MGHKREWREDKVEFPGLARSKIEDEEEGWRREASKLAESLDYSSSSFLALVLPPNNRNRNRTRTRYLNVEDRAIQNRPKTASSSRHSPISRIGRRG
jgi:hypothetical protein